MLVVLGGLEDKGTAILDIIDERRDSTLTSSPKSEKKHTHTHIDREVWVVPHDMTWLLLYCKISTDVSGSCKR